MGNNLAIYPQNYTIDIQCKPYYCCDKKEEKPCCEEEPLDDKRNVEKSYFRGSSRLRVKKYGTYFLPGQSTSLSPPLIGGCEGTRYGCCPDGITAKFDEEGSNCKDPCGENILSTVGILPGREPFFYNWNFIATYSFNNKSSEFTLIYDFTNSDIPEGNVTFQGQLQGTMTYNGLVFDASKYINYNYIYEEKKIIFTFYQNRLPKELIKVKNTLSINLIVKHIPLEVPVF